MGCPVVVVGALVHGQVAGSPAHRWGAWVGAMRAGRPSRVVGRCIRRVGGREAGRGCAAMVVPLGGGGGVRVAPHGASWMR